MRTFPLFNSPQSPDPSKRSLPWGPLRRSRKPWAQDLPPLTSPAPHLTCRLLTSFHLSARGPLLSHIQRTGSARELTPPKQPCPGRAVAILGSISMAPPDVLARSRAGGPRQRPVPVTCACITFGCFLMPFWSPKSCHSLPSFLWAPS